MSKRKSKAKIREMLASSGHERAQVVKDAAQAPPPTVPQDDLIRFFRCLAVMVTAGLPVHQAVAFLAQSDEGKLGPILVSVVTQVEQGSNLSRAFASFPKVFPAMAVHMVEVGESTGRMAFCLNDLADYMEKNQAIRRRMISALAYPVMLLALTAFMVLFMVLVIFPKQQQVFQDLHAELPFISKALMALGPGMSNPLFIGISLGILITLYLGRTPLQYYWRHRWQLPFDRWILTVPVVGPLITKAGTGQILNAMSTLLEAGVPLDQTKQAAELGMNRELRRRYLAFLGFIDAGDNLSEAVENSECFPPNVQHVFAVAQEHGSLSTLARKCAALYSEEVEWAFLNFASLAEPLALAFMGLVMGAVMLATFLPMISIIQHL